MPYLVQGFFFQRREWLTIGYEPGGFGERVFVREGLNQFMYAGAIWAELDDPSAELVGLLQDHFGTAKLSNIQVTDEQLSFTKIYTNRSDPIQYSFQRRGNLWVGEWSGPLVGRGITRCMLTEVSDSFFSPEEAGNR